MENDWIKKRADEEKREREKQDSQNKARQREDNLIRGLAPQFLVSLTNTVNANITEWNAAFPDKQFNGVERLLSGFKIVKPRYPGGEAQVIYNELSLRIDVQLIRPKPLELSEHYGESHSIILKETPDGKNIQMVDANGHYITYSNLSQALIEGIADDGHWKL